MAVKVNKDYGVVIQGRSKELKLQTLGKDKTLALVSYKDGMSLNVYEYTKEEAKELKKLLEDYLGYTTPVPEVETEAETEAEVETEAATEVKATDKVNDDIVKTLISIPANDVSYRTALREATQTELELAILMMEKNGGRNETRIKLCKGRLNMAQQRSTVTPKPEKTEPVEKAKILTFPTEDKKPRFIQLKTDGEATYEQCAEKLGKEKEMFKDTDSQYVIDGLIELAKVDQDFRNNIMREDKTYAGFMEYMFKAAQNGYCVKYGNVGWIDRDTGLGLAIDYYNNDDEKVKAEEEAKRKEEAKKREEESKAKSKTTKKGVKKNDKDIGKNKKRVNA